MGKLVNPGSSQESFLPAEYVKGKSQTRANIVALLLFAVVMAAVVGVFVINHQRWRNVRAQEIKVSAEFAEEAAKIEQLKQLEAQRTGLLEQAEVVTALIDRVPRSVLMAEIVSAMPEGLTLTNVQLEGERVRPPAPKPTAQGSRGQTRSLSQGGGAQGEAAPEEKPKVHPPKFKHVVNIEGLADANDKIADFLASLKDSPLFAGVELQLITGSLIDGVDYRKFKVTMQVRESADAREVAGTSEVGLDGAIAGDDEEVNIGSGVFSNAGSDSE